MPYYQNSPILGAFYNFFGSLKSSLAKQQALFRLLDIIENIVIMELTDIPVFV